MEIKKITDQAFSKYGRVLDMDVSDLLKRLATKAVPEDVFYTPSDTDLEGCVEFAEFSNSVFGGMPIQIGYCNGHNKALNAVEYHRDSEINIPTGETVFMLGSQQDIEADFSYDTSKMELFVAPAGSVVEFYATTLHFAPCAKGDNGFQVAVVLPKGTNTDTPELAGRFAEDKLMQARNKWLIAHDEWEGKGDAFVGLKGANLTI
jgi:hypothetical protein